MNQNATAREDGDALGAGWGRWLYKSSIARPARSIATSADQLTDQLDRLGVFLVHVFAH